MFLQKRLYKLLDLDILVTYLFLSSNYQLIFIIFESLS